MTLTELGKYIEHTASLIEANEATDDDIAGIATAFVLCQRHYTHKESCGAVVAALAPAGPTIREARAALANALIATCSGATDALTPPDVAKRLGVKPATVIGWIKSGQLKGSNIGKGARPRYRVTPDDLAAFLKSRQSEPPRKVPKAKRSKPSRF